MIFKIGGIRQPAQQFAPATNDPKDKMTIRARIADSNVRTNQSIYL